MTKKVLLKQTEHRDSDTVLDFSGFAGTPITGAGSTYRGRYVCPNCSKVQIKDASLPEVQTRFAAETRLLIKCSCGAFLLLYSAPSAA